MRPAITTVGPLARRFLDTHRDAWVEAVLERSIYLRAGDDFLLIASAGAPMGPFTVTVVDVARGTLPFAPWASPRTDAAVAIGGGALTIDGTTIPFMDAVEWRPSAVGPATSADTAGLLLRRALARIAAPPLDSPGAGRLACAAATAVGWLASGRAEPAAVGALPAPARLLGLGPGLTPAGDDVLCGMLLGLRLAAQTRRHDLLAELVAQWAPRRTSPLSRSYLAAAVAGLFVEPTMRLAASLAAADEVAVSGLVREVAAIGHTSGWYTLFGLGMVLCDAHVGVSDTR